MRCIPYGDHDDLVDSMTMAVMRFRQGGFLPHPEDYEDEKGEVVEFPQKRTFKEEIEAMKKSGDL
jgi:hypothetical protein